MKIGAIYLSFFLSIQFAFAQTTYTFTGNGNWSVSSNWAGSIIPPNPLPAGQIIYISPQIGDSCVLDIAQTINQGASLVVTQGSNFIITGLLTTPVMLKRVIEIDTTLSPPLDTISRIELKYDNNGRISLFSYSNTNSTGDTLNSFRFWYLYNLNDSLAYQTIRHTTYETDPVNKVDSTIYNFTGDKLQYDSNYFHENNYFLEYNTRNLTHFVDRIAMRGTTYMQIAGGSYTRRANYYMNYLNGCITQQEDTVVTESPFQVSYYKHNHVFSYLPNPNPLYVILTPIYSGFLYSDRSYFGFETEQKLILSSHNWTTKTWGYVGNYIINNSEYYEYIFRQDGYPQQARKISTQGTYPTKITRIIYFY